MRNKGKRMLTFFLVIILYTTSLTVNASQSRGGNFNKNYTLNGSQADNIVAVALAQQGKTKAQLGYTEAWCADFVSDCAQLAGVGDIIPFDGYCQTLYNKVKNAGGRDVSSPKKGDLVFYYCSECAVHWCHVGLMIDSQRSIEGNYGGKVSLVNGAYRDSAGHSLSNGIVTRKFVAPAYRGNTSSLIAPQLSLSAGTNTYEQGKSINFNWTWGGADASGYNLYIAKLIPGTNQYDWNSARRVYFPGNATTSGVVEPSAFASGGAFAAYIQAWNIPSDKKSGQSNFVWFVVKENTPKKGKAQWKIWISKSKMGDETQVVPLGKTCYLCYQIIDKDTQKNWDELYKSNYKVKETIMKSNGATCNSSTYSNDNNWIAITPTEAGEYKGTVEISGDFTGQLECDFTAKDFYYGDINGDGDITVTDLAMANQAVNNTKILTADQKKRADVNADGAVTEEDVTLIQQYVLGVITEFPAESHVHSYSSKVTKSATCTSAGIRTYSCVCGESYATAIPRISHTTASDQAVAATCTRNGKTAGSHCSVCGTVLKAQAVVPMTGHHKVLKDAREASCTQAGYTGDTYCKDCGAKLSDGKIIAPKAHIWDAGKVTKQSTAVKEGEKSYTCSVCGAVRAEQIPASGITKVSDKAEVEKDDGVDNPYENDKNEDDALEVGDMLYDALGKAEYKVIKITGSTVFVSYNTTLNKRQKAITVPNQITTEDGIICKVTAVSERAFYNNKNVKKITLGNHITKIGARAFSGCKKLSSLTIKSKKISSKSLSSKAFKGISSKVKVKAPREKRNSYRRLFLKKGLSKKVKICNI